MLAGKYRVNEKDLIEYKKKDWARRLVLKAIKAKEITRPKNCDLCEKEATVEAHHIDYGRPLVLYWLCDCCHGIVHRKSHPLNPDNNQQTEIPMCWTGNESCTVTVTLPFENFIVLKKIAEEKRMSISRVLRGIVLREYPVEDNQLTFDFEKRRTHDNSQHDAVQRIYHLEENEEYLLESKGSRIQQVRSQRDSSLFDLDRELPTILERHGSCT